MGPTAKHEYEYPKNKEYDKMLSKKRYYYDVKNRAIRAIRDGEEWWPEQKSVNTDLLPDDLFEV